MYDRRLISSRNINYDTTVRLQSPMGGIHLTQIADHEVEGTPEHVVSPMRHPTQGEKGNGTAVGIAVCEVGIHSFRHTWVTRSAEDGVDSITIREVVGWGSPAMKRVYTHVSQEHVRSQMDKRTSKACPSPEEHPAIPVAAGVADVGSMDTDGIKELARRLADELAKP